MQNTSFYNDTREEQNTSKTLTIRGRLLLGFFTIAMITSIAIVITFVKTMTAETAAEQVINYDLPSYNTHEDLNKQIFELTVLLQNWLLTQNPNDKVQIENNWDSIHHLTTNINTLATQWTDNERRQSWQQTQTLLEQLRTETTNVSNTTNLQEAANRFTQNFWPIANEILNNLDGTKDTEGQRTGGMQSINYDKLHSGAESIINNMRIIMVIEGLVLLACLLAAWIIAKQTTQKILQPINKAILVSRKIAAGDLTDRVHVENNDEMGRLGHDLNAMSTSLKSITQKIIEAAHNMFTTLQEVKSSAEAQSTGTAEQASAINEITASLAEIEKSATQTMEKAQILGKLAEKTYEKGQLGLQSVEESVAGMKVVREKVQMIAQTILDLSNSTQQVWEITALINRLAQQSTMLALNASIEAAKAGEAGKGFAVVAAEVKNLAEQSEQSTAQIQKILEEIRQATEKAVMVTEEGTKGVDHGTTLVEQTGEVVHSLNAAIHETMTASQHIEAAVRQETTGIEQITTGMNEINQVTSSFVASVRQTTEAIGHLDNIAKQLKEQVEVYKL